MNRFDPILGQFMKRLRPMRSLEQAAIETIEEHPAEEGPTKPIVFLDEDRAQVTGTYGEKSVADEWDRVDGYYAYHDATTRYVFENVLATPFGFFTGLDAFARYGPIQYRKLLSAKIEVREKGYYATSPVCLRYFGHWARDGLTSVYLRRPDEDLYLPHDPSWPHARQYIDLLGIDRVQSEYVFFKELSYSPDIGQNSGRAARLSRLRADVRRVAGDAGIPGVFIRRGRSGSARVLNNEDQLAAALAARGFAIVSTTDDLLTIWRKAGGAPVTVSMEGSHWNHVFLASKEDAFHVVLNPADRFNNVYAEFLDKIPGQLAGTLARRDQGGYTVDIDRVLRLIDDRGRAGADRTRAAAEV